MADQATSSITIDATRSAVMDVIADFEAYPEWAGFVKQAEVLDAGSRGRPAKARFVLDAGVLKADYTLAYTWADDDSVVSWTLESGSLKEMTGSYALAGDSPTDVTYALSVDIGVPMLGMFKRKAEKVIMDTALKELKKRVEG
jgi:ribosome-associated toxin RatA of RatAB toxin-antitoxin module